MTLTWQKSPLVRAKNSIKGTFWTSITPLDETMSTLVRLHDPLLDPSLAIVDPQRLKFEVKVLDVLKVMR
jgi:hypothetical protein